MGRGRDFEFAEDSGVGKGMKDRAWTKRTGRRETGPKEFACFMWPGATGG